MAEGGYLPEDLDPTELNEPKDDENNDTIYLSPKHPPLLQIIKTLLMRRKKKLHLEVLMKKRDC